MRRRLARGAVERDHPGARADRAGRDASARRRDRPRPAHPHADAVPRRRERRQRRRVSRRRSRATSCRSRAARAWSIRRRSRSPDRSSAEGHFGALVRALQVAGRADGDLLAGSRRARVAAGARAAAGDRPPGVRHDRLPAPPAAVRRRAARDGGAAAAGRRSRAGCAWARCARCSRGCSIRRWAARRWCKPRA